MGAIYAGAILGGAIMCLIGFIRVRHAEGARKKLIVATMTILGAAIGAGLGAQFVVT